MNKEEALKYFKMAADNNNDDGMYNYGMILMGGEGIPANKEEGLKYLKMASEKGHSNAKIQYEKMINMKDDDEDDDPDINKNRIKRLKEGIKNGDPKAMNDYAMFIENEDDMEESIKYYKMAIDRGYAISMHNYAYLLLNGIGVDQDIKEALKYFKMAGDHGYAESMNYYAFMVERGEGTEVDMQEALKYYKMAAENGYVTSLLNLGSIYKKGAHEIKPDLKEALKYYKMAADKDDAEGMYNYASLLFDSGENVEEAVHYCKMAADEGEPNAMYCYSKILEKGVIGQPDHQGSLKYLLMAAKAGNDSAILELVSKNENESNIENDDEKEEEEEADDEDMLSILLKLHTLLE